MLIENDKQRLLKIFKMKIRVKQIIFKNKIITDDILNYGSIFRKIAFCLFIVLGFNSLTLKAQSNIDTSNNLTNGRQSFDNNSESETTSILKVNFLQKKSYMELNMQNICSLAKAFGQSLSPEQLAYLQPEMFVNNNIIKKSETHSNVTLSTPSTFLVYKDQEFPTIIAPPDILIALDSFKGNLNDLDIGFPIVADNIEVVTIKNNMPEDLKYGVTMIKWTAVDADGNESSAYQIIEIVASIADAISKK